MMQRGLAPTAAALGMGGRRERERQRAEGEGESVCGIHSERIEGRVSIASWHRRSLLQTHPHHRAVQRRPEQRPQSGGRAGERAEGDAESRTPSQGEGSPAVDGQTPCAHAHSLAESNEVIGSDATLDHCDGCAQPLIRWPMKGKRKTKREKKK